MLKEIGSNFWMDPNNRYDRTEKITPEVFGVKGSDYVWLSTGRSAISIAIEEDEKRNPGKRKIALIPSYTCHTVIDPFVKAGYEVKGYSVDEGLCIDGEELLKEVKETNAGIVLIHPYFGFDTISGWKDKDTKTKIKNLGVTLIEDRTQCLYSNVELLGADYIVGSIRKWHGVPDGGFLVCREGVLSYKPEGADLLLEQAKKEASIMKYNYLYHQTGVKEEFLAKYAQAEEILDCQSKEYAISDTSLQMQACLDIEELKEKRRQNYTYLLEHLPESERISFVFPELPKEVVPLYFPVLTRDRKEVQSYLREHDIYAPIVWPKAETAPAVCKEADLFYKEMLCIPIDQRYGCEEMEKIAECLGKCCE